MDDNKIIYLEDLRESKFDDAGAEEQASDMVGTEDSAQTAALLPPAIHEYMVKTLLGAIVFAIGSIVISVYMHSFGPLVLLLGAAYFGYKSFAVRGRYFNGFIAEVPAICTNVKPARWQDRVVVTFKSVPDDPEEPPEFYQFSNLSKKSEDRFMPGHPYMIYYDVDEPKVLINYTNL